MSRDGWSIESAIKKGRKLPDWYQEGLYETEYERYFISSYFDLATERLFEGGCIPWSKTLQYAEQYKGLDSELTELFVEIIHELDATFLKDMREQQSKK